MLDILLSTLPQQAAQPVPPSQVKQSAVEQVTPHRPPLSVTQPAISAPESILPKIQARPKVGEAETAAAQSSTALSNQVVQPITSRRTLPQFASQQRKPANPVVTQKHATIAPRSQQSKPKVTQKPTISTNSEVYTPISLSAQQLAAIDSRNLPTTPVETPEQAATRKIFEAAKAERLKLLEQKLAELVESEKPLKQELLRQNLRNAALNYAKAGQLDQARAAAKDLILSPFAQAEVLTQIDAIAAERNTPTTPKIGFAKTPSAVRAIPLQVRAPQAPTYLVPNSVSPVSPSMLGSHLRLTRPWKLPGGISLMFPLPFAVPMTSGFGWRMHPVTGQQRFHSGVDLAAPTGTPVVATFSGRVAVADWMNGYGLTIILSPKDGKQEALYAHLSAVFVKPGDWVEQGTLIGQVGSTGLSTGPHLHFELRQLSDIGWEPIDPSLPLGVALAKIGEYVAIAQQPPTAIDSPPTYLTIPPPPTQKFSILHNF